MSDKNGQIQTAWASYAVAGGIGCIFGTGWAFLTLDGRGGLVFADENGNPTGTAVIGDAMAGGHATVLLGGLAGELSASVSADPTGHFATTGLSFVACAMGTRKAVHYFSE